MLETRWAGPVTGTLRVRSGEEGLWLCLEGRVLSRRKLGVGTVDLTVPGASWQAEAAEGQEVLSRGSEPEFGPWPSQWGVWMVCVWICGQTLTRLRLLRPTGTGTSEREACPVQQRTRIWGWTPEIITGVSHL